MNNSLQGAALPTRFRHCRPGACLNYVAYAIAYVIITTTIGFTLGHLFDDDECLMLFGGIFFIFTPISFIVFVIFVFWLEPPK